MNSFDKMCCSNAFFYHPTLSKDRGLVKWIPRKGFPITSMTGLIIFLIGIYYYKCSPLSPREQHMKKPSSDINDDILCSIGNTPLVRINKLNPNKNTTIYAKLEGFNPTGSIKDRIALSMIQQAEAEGKLIKGKTIIEPTSGNTGVALAMIGAIKGYDVEIVMSDSVWVERRQMIKAFGGTVTLSEGKFGTDGAIRKARELVKANPDKYFMPDSSPINITR
jgi:threonine dehydratase